MAQKVDFLTFLTHFGHFGGFLTEMKKSEKNEKRCGSFHALCVHASMCKVPNNLKQLGTPNITYAEGLVNKSKYKSNFKDIFFFEEQVFLHQMQKHDFIKIVSKCWWCTLRNLFALYPSKGYRKRGKHEFCCKRCILGRCQVCLFWFYSLDPSDMPQNENSKPCKYKYNSI